MLKLIHVSRREESVEGLVSQRLRERLAAAGVRRLQLNLDDADVASAQLRTTSEPKPIRSIVTTWTDGDADDVTKALGELDDHVAGWQVEERSPLVPPAEPDGRRADAFAQVAFLRRPTDLSREEWLERWIGSHTQVAIDTQSTFGYVQNVVAAPVTDNALPVAAVVEELFPPAAMTDWHVFYDTGGDAAELERRMGLMQQSVDRFGGRHDIEVVPTSRYVFDLRG